ncbi:MAG TPA: TonB-dependent receptor plug domain-containing protein, partial [Pseudolabrys sp.]|nr:TonB-dependent receptor plug domain-containing protein [Pseudolabrys sp.]
MERTMKQKLLVSSILLGLAVALPIGSLHAQNAGDQDTDKSKEEKLQTVTVTGSLIPRAQVETASPVITISGQDLETHGFRNVYDALHTMPVATGSVQDSQVASFGSFTPGATTISLFGLDPGFTLILLNGHPLADYPLPYNGTQNITDLSTIPIEAVDHIDILSGGQSSLYGSSAIAGVVNVVLKKKIEGFNLSVRGGGYSNGGGGNERVQISGGTSSGNLSVNYSLSFENQDPVRFHSSFFSNRADNPLGTAAGRDFLELEPFTGHYFDPGSETCDALHNLFGGTLEYSHRSG